MSNRKKIKLKNLPGLNLPTFATVKAVMKMDETSDLSKVRPWKDGDITSEVRSVGSTKCCYITHDDLIIPELPEEVKKAFADHGDKTCVALRQEEGHVTMFYQFNKSESPLGRLLMIDLRFDINEVLNNPTSASSRYWAQITSMIAGFMSYANHDEFMKHCTEGINDLKKQGLIE